jgi:hypothetical protein
MGRLRKTSKPLPPFEQFPVVDDIKLKMTIVALADKYNTGIRQIIYRTYNDPQLMSIYQGIRNSNIYAKGGKYRRKIYEIPNAYVWDFLNTVLGAMYGSDWWKDNRAIRHELVRPWWVVNHI